MTEPDRDPCHGCAALIVRAGGYPDCERAALYGGVGCLRGRGKGVPPLSSSSSRAGRSGYSKPGRQER